MLNYLWGGMIVVAVVYGILNGTVTAVSDAALDCAGEAVELCITMLGVMALWTGLMQIAKASGLMERLTRCMEPVLRFFFPELPPEAKAKEYIASNMLANILGLGWAATPFGLKAMEELKRLHTEAGGDKEVASRSMCTFLILNISSLQIIPVTIITYRSQYGSVNPAGIVAPAILATLASTLAAAVFVKLAGRGGKEK